MRVLTQTELTRCTRSELHALLAKIAAALPELAENSAELGRAHMNLRNIRAALARPVPGLRP